MTFLLGRLFKFRLPPAFFLLVGLITSTTLLIFHATSDDKSSIVGRMSRFSASNGGVDSFYNAIEGLDHSGDDGNTAMDRDVNDGCWGWSPHDPEEVDPPECFRAKQFRQIQRFRKSRRAETMNQKCMETINYIERCAFGVIKCPKRPLIIADWWYQVEPGMAMGEAIWLHEVNIALEELEYSLLLDEDDHHLERAIWNVTRQLDLSLHMYMTSGQSAFFCLTDPRCVRQEDYNEHANKSTAVNINELDKDRIGTLPAWRVMALSFWGGRPSGLDGITVDARNQWGMVNTEWSYHKLGPKWTLVPYDYPGHTWLPISIERRCLSSPLTPYEKRDNNILILAKKSEIFHEDLCRPLFHEWERIGHEVGKSGFQLLSLAEVSDQHPMPGNLSTSGMVDPVTYGRIVSGAKAMLGIGKPEISPSPYISLCRGVPVVMPFHKDPKPEGWTQFSKHWFQHGPIAHIPEPYAYLYNMSDPDDLIRQLTKAASTPIDSFIPPEMTMSALHRRVREIFHDTDWEAEFHKVIQENGGIQPRYPDIMIETCHGPEGLCRGRIPPHNRSMLFDQDGK